MWNECKRLLNKRNDSLIILCNICITSVKNLMEWTCTALCKLLGSHDTSWVSSWSDQQLASVWCSRGRHCKVEEWMANTKPFRPSAVGLLVSESLTFRVKIPALLVFVGVHTYNYICTHQTCAQNTGHTNNTFLWIWFLSYLQCCNNMNSRYSDKRTLDQNCFMKST
jgi:hypothetical protein